LDHIRVLSFWIKRGYDSEKAEKRFLDHIRVLSFWIKRGYDLKRAEKRRVFFHIVEVIIIVGRVIVSSAYYIF
jgi:hypothetical protein